MLVVVPDLINADELREMRRIGAAGGFGSGKATAGANVRAVKDNLELQGEAATARLRAMIQQAFARSTLVSDAVLPRMMTAPLMSLYRAGMAYGTHLDLAMAERNRLRSDLSMTLFLSDPDAYAGGELVIESDYGVQQVRLPAGHAVFYPTLFPHRVAKVERGERLACVLWIQSLVREPDRRRILFDLAQTGGCLERPRQDEAYAMLMRCHQNLLRMWSS